MKTVSDEFHVLICHEICELAKLEMELGDGHKDRPLVSDYKASMLTLYSGLKKGLAGRISRAEVYQLIEANEQLAGEVKKRGLLRGIGRPDGADEVKPT